MEFLYDAAPTRRRLLIGLSGLGLAALLPLPRAGMAAAEGGGAAAARRLVAAPARVPLLGGDHPGTAVWAYEGRVPGPEIRLRQGERLRIRVENRLAQDTTIHWHGLRVPNAMDGVPGLTQPSIAPGGSFLYEFAVPDAGTYLYHSHAHSAEQMGRGLFGPIVVEEPAPPEVDRDVVWVLSDWRLRQDASIVGDFDRPMEMGMAGRIGNTVTINGRLPDVFPVRAGERIRLRLVNAAAARIFGLDFEGHRPLVVAYDGQPVEPHAPAGGRLVLGPAMRADLILDMTGAPGSRAAVTDGFYPDRAYRLVELAYGVEPPLRKQPLAPPRPLPANTMPEPDLDRARREEVVIEGGMMGGMGRMRMGGGGMGGMMSGRMWTVNGVAAQGDVMPPMLTLERGASCVVAMRNETAWYHPMHLHGHSFRVIARDGKPTRYREWRDTVLMAPRERVDIAFVADNPGDWLFHCHILQHMDGGLMGVFRIA